MIDSSKPPEALRLIPTGPEWMLPLPYELLGLIAVTVNPTSGDETREEVLGCRAQFFERRTSQSGEHVDWMVTAEPVGDAGVIAGCSRLELPDGSTGDFNDPLTGADRDELLRLVEAGMLFDDFVDPKDEDDMLEREAQGDE